MMTLGIDIGKKRHNATLLDESGYKVIHNLVFSNDEAGLKKLLQQISAAKLSPQGILVGMEATGHYWMNLYSRLIEEEFIDIHVINPIIIHARKNDRIRGAKTDRIDAFQIAKYIREVDHCKSAIPEDLTLHLREIARLRFDLNSAATSEKVRLVGLLDRVFPEYKEQFGDIFCRTSLNVLEEYPTAEAVAKVDVRRLTILLKKASHGRNGRQKADQLKKAARHSFALAEVGMCLPLEVQFTVQRLNLLIDQIHQLQAELSKLMKDQQALLRKIPGIGEIWAPLILGEILPVFHPEEKNGANTLVAYAGLDAIANMTGKDYEHPDRPTRMSKRGSKYLRTAAMEAAFYAATTGKDPMFADIYQRQRAKGKHHKVALSHVARKMLHVIFAVLRDQKEYQPVV